MIMKEKLILFLYLSVAFILPFGASDRSSTQIFYISGLNILSYLVFLFDKNQRNRMFSFIKKDIFFICFFAFSFWSVFTIFFSYNISESLRVITELIAYLSSIPIINYCLKQNQKNIKFVILMIPVLLSIEILFIVAPYLYDTLTSSVINRSQRYSGFTGNVNIAAFSIVLKLPFVWHYIAKFKKQYLKLTGLFIVYFFGVFSIIIIHQTRGALIALITLLILFLIFQFSQKKEFKSFFKNAFLFIIPVILVFSINGILENFNSSYTSVNSRMSSLQESSDVSVQSRMRYYKTAFESIKDNPVTGIGIGNWALEDIKRAPKAIIGYVVGYHVHNDFLEIAAETGITGFILFYGLVFWLLLWIVYQNIKNKSNQTQQIIFLSLTGFLIDSLFNFPFSRPIQMIQFIFCICLFFSSEIISFKGFNTTVIKTAFILILLILPINFYGSYRVYNANVDFYTLLGEYNYGIHDRPLSEVEKFQDDFPNLTGTTLPVKALKGIYYFKKDSLKMAEKYFRQAVKDNPFIKISETYLGFTKFKLNEIDSALYYTKDAFYTLPNNPAHYTYYMAALTSKYDTLEINKAYDIMKGYRPNDEFVDDVYTLSLSKLLDKVESNSILSRANKNLLETKDDQIKGNIYILNFGRQKVVEAFELHEKGLEFFENNDFEKAAIYFEKAALINSLEAPYYENAANAYIKIGNNEKAEFFVDFILNEINPKNGKAYYMKAILELDKGNQNQACGFLLDSYKNGFKGALTVYDNYCK